jgi:uncharacterized protein (TIGR03086 family)
MSGLPGTLNNTRKYVVSSRPPGYVMAELHRHRRPGRPHHGGIQKVRHERAETVCIGSGTLVTWLMRADLVDEYKFLAQPVIAGRGKHLFTDGYRRPHGTTPDPRAENLEPGWRDRIAADLAALADAWKAPEAWDGMTQVGNLDLPGAMAGRMALGELVIHGWDIAQATGQPFDFDAAALSEVESTMQQVRGGNDGEIPCLFGPVVPISGDASTLDRALGLTGRDPAWSPK